MSVYKPKASPFYHYDFQWRGRRFCGSTGRAQKPQAREVEKAKRREAEAIVARDVERGDEADGVPRRLGAAVLRYFREVGQHHVNAETTLTDLERLTTWFGEDRPLDSIRDDDVAKLVAWRRGHRVKDRATGPLISPATVNRSTTQVLRKLLNYAIDVWGTPIAQPPKWKKKKHMLPEPEERVREVRAGEEGDLDAIRDEYRVVADFSRASGLRMVSCLLRKSEVDLLGGSLHTIGKGGKRIEKRLTSEMRAILMEAMANETEWVFTYVARRDFDPARPPGGAKGRAGAVAHKKGQRVPITASGLKTAWRRARKARKGEPSLPADLRFHDLRHDFATKLLRTTGNLKLVSRALDHSRIETTSRYAHVLDDDLLAGMEAASATRRSPEKSPEAGGSTRKKQAG